VVFTGVAALTYRAEAHIVEQPVAPSLDPLSKGSSPQITIGSKQRVLGLDLVRATAIAFVLVGHTVQTTAAVYGKSVVLRVAMVGVELFFVLSGFLIGGLLLDILSRGSSLRAWLLFLSRRWLRTVPLYIVWVLILLVVRPPPGERAKYAWTYLTFTQNLAWPMPTDGWFGVSWSLAVEEWFYLSFSAVLLGLARIWPRRAVIATCATFLIGPLVARLVFDSGWADGNAYAPRIVLLRLDSIATGVVVVVLHRWKFDALIRWRHALLVAGLGVLLAAWLLRRAEPSLPLLRAVISNFFSLGSALIVLGCVHWTRGPALLARPIRWLSERSYGLYVIHLSVMTLAARAFAQNLLPAILFLPVVLGISAALADISFRFFERPILRVRPRQFVDLPVALGQQALSGVTSAR
jgi:peptidoglycan/LPS O-acetylase OafA/YrhL